MQTETILYICIAGTTALILALFQYVYRSKLKPKLKYGLFALRTLTFFFIGLLLINPQFESNTYSTKKPPLVLAVDNSESVSFLEQKENALAVLNQLQSNTTLRERFDIKRFSFGSSLNSDEQLQFNEKQSNITHALKQIFNVYSNEDQVPIVLISDGNQTYGEDYSYISNNGKQPIYPVILGDSTKYMDLRLKQVNVNRYVYVKNRFPVEIIANYEGTERITTKLNIWNNNRLLYTRPVNFGPDQASEIINTNITASKVGVSAYRIELEAMDKEKNKVNNIKNFAVEIIDQKTNIALVTELIHPDIGAIKKSIESNEQRTVSILNPKEFSVKNNDYQLVILYQPTLNFNSVFDEIKNQNLNTFVITGTSTDYDYLNTTHLELFTTVTRQTEIFQAALNTAYSNFIINTLDFDGFPPLKSEFGSLEFRVPSDVILYKTVNGFDTGEALLATYRLDQTKHALLNGEGIWRWRAHTFLETDSFNDFDNFINNLVQYLSSNKKRNRLNLDYESFYSGNDDILITAQYFNENYEFDNSATLSLSLTNEEGTLVKEVPLLLDNGLYRINLSGIRPGNYTFTIRHATESVASSGQFEVLEFNVEQQFLNADIEKLYNLAEISDGAAFYSDQTEDLINNILADKRYKTIQKSTKNVVPLIDWYYLLVLISLSLFLEWFIRKYNGLI
jgi:hypothetical protein